MPVAVAQQPAACAVTNQAGAFKGKQRSITRHRSDYRYGAGTEIA